VTEGSSLKFSSWGWGPNDYSPPTWSCL